MLLTVENTTLYKKLSENRGYASPQFLSVLEPMLGLKRTTDPCFDRVAWDVSGNLMGIPEGGLGYDAFIGWASRLQFDSNLRGLNEHVGGTHEEANLISEYCLGLRVN